eukprot:INCI15034.1.p1 GENE.INCI15034.1~~INCI15034.1.p1  ORF type:complete len:672 (-),score=117.93 INCI15034.1:1972-3987(-)
MASSTAAVADGVTTLPGTGASDVFNATGSAQPTLASTSDPPRSTVDAALEVINNEAKLATYIGTTLTLAFIVAAIVTLIMLALQRIRHKKQMRRAFNNAARGHAFGAAAAGLRRRPAKIQRYDSDDVHTTDDENEDELEVPEDDDEDSDGPSQPSVKGDKKKTLASKLSALASASKTVSGNVTRKNQKRNRGTSAEKRSSLMSELDTVLETAGDAAPEHVAPAKRRDLRPKEQSVTHPTTPASSASKSLSPKRDRRRQGRRQSVAPAASVKSPAELKSVVVVDASSPRKDTKKSTRRRHRGGDDFLLQFYKSSHAPQHETIAKSLQVEGASGETPQKASDVQASGAGGDPASVSAEASHNSAEARHNRSSERIVRQVSTGVADIEPKRVGPRRRRGTSQDVEAATGPEGAEGPIQLHDALTPTNDGDNANPGASPHATESDRASTQGNADGPTAASSGQSDLSMEDTPFATLVSQRSSALMAARQWSKHHAARSHVVAPAASVAGSSSGGMPMLGTFSDFVARRASASTAARRWGRRHRKAASLSSTPSPSWATHKVSPEKSVPATSESGHSRHSRQLSADMADMVNGDALVEALALFEEGGQLDAETTQSNQIEEDASNAGSNAAQFPTVETSRASHVRRQISLAPSGSKEDLHAAIALFETDDTTALSV